MSRKLKILVNAIPAANPVTGIGRYVLELYAAMQEVGGRELDVVFFDGRGLARTPPVGPRNLARFTRLGRMYWGLPLAVALPIRLALHWRRERLFRSLSAGADIYHETAFFPFLPAPGVRIVQTVHDLSLQIHPEWHPAERVAYAERYFAKRLRLSSAVLCVSNFTREELIRYAPDLAARSVVTPLGVDPRFKPASVESCARVRERYNLPEKFLLFVGSGDPRKNTRALQEIVARGRMGCPLVCVGWSGWLKPVEQARVIVLGYLPDEDLPALYGAAVAFVFPSHYEGFGLPVVEAMACGCPVVVPRAHTMPELVGESGCYFGDPTDTDQLEQCLIRLVGDGVERAALSAAGMVRARQFDWKRTAELTLDAFESVL